MNFAELKSLTIPEGTVTKITDASGNVLWSTSGAPTQYLTFTAPETFSISVASLYWNGIMYYSTDAMTWNEWDGSEISGTELYFCGTGNTRITDNGGGVTCPWTLSGSDISCEGNIESLLDHVSVASGIHPSMSDRCYKRMFCNCTSLTQAPELPATTVGMSCYADMFYGCTSLAQAPELPATTLAWGCYRGMFEGCTSLIQAPVLPATTLSNYCYQQMFYGCTSLTTAPELPATTLATGCYDQMFEECAFLIQAPELPATTLAKACYQRMFAICTSLTIPPELSAITLADECYDEMFTSCKGIKLSSTKTGFYARSYRIPVSGAGVISTDSLTNMFAYTGGAFTGTPEINTTYYLYDPDAIVSIPVTITGSGSGSYCYATIGGTKYTSATSGIEVMAGDVIVFGVYGRSSSYYGAVTIDGTQALKVTSMATKTYEWTVPDGVTAISIAFTYTSASSRRNGKITVTTS